MPRPQRPRPPIRGTIWHFTDLHFSVAPPVAREDSKARPYGRKFFEGDPFRALLEYAGDAEDLRADFLVFSGDFIDATALPPSSEGDDRDRESQRKARRTAFAFARQFIVDMAKAHKLDRYMHERVVVCPGNHDVDWSAALKEPGESLTDYLASFGAFLGHHSDRPFTPPGTGGVCILPLDTTPLGGAPFHDISQAPVQLDAGAYVPRQIDTALATLRRDATGRTACPHGVLGIVVSHHPPTVTPTPEVEVKPFEIAIGAGQAKYRLHSEGFRVFLTGHKHMAVAHQESLYPFSGDSAEGLVILTGAPFSADAGRKRGFQVLEYAVAPDSGETRILVHAHDFDGFTPQPQPPRSFSIAAHDVRPAAVLRLTHRIGISGDSRADFEFQGVPIPSGDELTGWTLKNHKWVRQFWREEASDQDTASRPLVASLVPGATVKADVPEHLKTKANRSFCIQVDVPRNTRHQFISFMERVFHHGAFAVSKGHQRRVCGNSNVCPGVELGWEGIFHFLREPVHRLEFSIHLPFALRGQYLVELEVWTEGSDGEYTPDPSLLRFSPHRIETNFRAKRISVTVDQPLVGVGYCVKWELPENDPALGETGPPEAAHEQAIQWAMALQSMVLRFGTDRHGQIEEALRELMEGHIGELISAGVAARDDQIEWALFVPDRRGDARPTTTPEGRPVLTPAFASYGSTDQQWMNWPAGVGVVGRAFALNSEVEAIRPRSSRYVPPSQDEWTNPRMPVYEAKPGSIDHSVLYGLPVHVPDRADIVWGVLSIGTSREFSGLDLNKPLRPPPASAGVAVPALHELMKSLTDDFSRKLARLMIDGIPFAEPLRD